MCPDVQMFSCDLHVVEGMRLEVCCLQVHTLLHVMCQETEIAEVELQV